MKRLLAVYVKRTVGLQDSTEELVYRNGGLKERTGVLKQGRNKGLDVSRTSWLQDSAEGLEDSRTVELT